MPVLWYKDKSEGVKPDYYFYGERLESDEFNEYGIRPGESVTLNLVTFTRETNGPDSWIVDWVAYDIYKDGVLLPD